MELAGIEDNANESTIDDVEFLANTGLERFNFGFVFELSGRASFRVLRY